MSGLKKLLAGLGIGAAATASEEAEASPFFHASKYIFQKPKAVPDKITMGNVYGPGFYGLEEDLPDYFNALKYKAKRDYQTDILQQVIDQFPNQQVIPMQLTDLLPEQRRIPLNPAGVNRAINTLGEDATPFIQTLDDLVASKPFKSNVNMAEYDFDVNPKRILPYDAPAEDYPALINELLAKVGGYEDVLEGASVGDAVSGMAYNGPQDVIDILLGKGWRGMRHMDDVTDTPGLTSFAPEDDLRFINRRYSE
jgi:hypothetical protein